MSFGTLESRCPGRSWYAVLWWLFCAHSVRVILYFFCRLHIFGRKNIPATGPIIFISNHQSNLDPMICGAATTLRPGRPFAKESLFRFPLGILIRSFGALPVKGGGRDKTVMRLAVQVLDAGRTVSIFPEGSRTFDGQMTSFKPGIGILLKRGKACVVPMAVEGAFDAWPRGSRPRFGSCVECEVGLPIEHDELMKDGVSPALRRLEEEVDRLRLKCRERIRARTGGRLPASGPGDHPFSLEHGGEAK